MSDDGMRDHADAAEYMAIDEPSQRPYLRLVGEVEPMEVA